MEQVAKCTLHKTISEHICTLLRLAINELTVFKHFTLLSSYTYSGM